MPNLDIINGEIAELESKTLTYAVAERLAWLYILRDHCCVGSAPSSGPVDTRIIDYTSDTDFSRTVAGRNCNDVMPIIDELMSTLQIVQPRLYDGVMIRLQG